jgi:hypothetical protein
MRARLTVGLLLLLVLALSLPALAGKVKPSAVSAGDQGGQPPFEAGKTLGFYIWLEKKVLHIRWVTDGKPVLFSGRLDLDKPLGEVKRIREDAGGWAQAHGNRIVMFSSTSRGEIDGVDVTLTGGAKAELELKIDGKDPDLEQLYFGAKGVHPKGIPLLLQLQ